MGGAGRYLQLQQIRAKSDMREMVHKIVSACQISQENDRKHISEWGKGKKGTILSISGFNHLGLPDKGLSCLLLFPRTSTELFCRHELKIRCAVRHKYCKATELVLPR